MATSPLPAVTLSTASVYPRPASLAFDLASRLGYDGVEVMVTAEPVTQEAGALKALAEHREVPIRSIHAPTLLLTQRVWGPQPWAKVDRALELADQVGAHTVVVHPPFRWQRGYAEEFVDGVASREQEAGIAIAVENMYPWRTGVSEVEAYLPHWDPCEIGYANVTLDLSHAATSGSDGLELARQLGPRLRHLHLADGSGSAMDEHLVPGRGAQPCGQVLAYLTEAEFAGDVVLEVATRKLEDAECEADLAEALSFARRHLAAEAPAGLTDSDSEPLAGAGSEQRDRASS